MLDMSGEAGWERLEGETWSTAGDGLFGGVFVFCSEEDPGEAECS